MNLILGLILATIISWLNFVIVDTFLGLPEAPGVKGAETVGYSIKNRKGDLAGGFFQGNILCSPDASAGTLIASIGVYILGIQGLCADPGYAGTTGALTMTLLIFIFSFIGITPEMFICGMVIAIFTIQGIHHPTSSRLIGKIAKSFGRYTKYE